MSSIKGINMRQNDASESVPAQLNGVATAATALEWFHCLSACALCCLCQPIVLEPRLGSWKRDPALDELLTTRKSSDERQYIALKEEHGPCALLNVGSLRCMRYNDRPWHCRAYPFQFTVESDPERSVGIEATVTLSCPAVLPRDRQGGERLRRLFKRRWSDKNQRRASNDGSSAAPPQIIGLLAQYPARQRTQLLDTVRTRYQELWNRLDKRGLNLPWSLIQDALSSVLADMVASLNDPPGNGMLAQAYAWSLDIESGYRFALEFANAVRNGAQGATAETNELLECLLRRAWSSYKTAPDTRHDPLSVALASFYRQLLHQPLSATPIWLDDAMRWNIFTSKRRNWATAATSTDVKQYAFHSLRLDDDGAIAPVMSGERNAERAQWVMDCSILAEFELERATAKAVAVDYLSLKLVENLFYGQTLWLCAEYECRWPLVNAAVYGVVRLTAALWVRAVLLAQALDAEVVDECVLLHAIGVLEQELYAWPSIGAQL